MSTVTTSSLRVPRYRRSDARPLRETRGLLDILTPNAGDPPEMGRAQVELQARAPAVKKTHLLEHPLAQHAVTMLRNKLTSPAQFRTICNQLLVLLTVESARTLPTRDESIETALAPHTGQVLARPVVFLSVTRHGLGLSHAIADFIPGVLVGAVSLERAPDSHAMEPRLHLPNAPALGDVRVILFDPVVASGGSVSVALNLLRRSGATDISLLSFLVSLPGLSRIQSSFPDVTVWTAAIDSEMDPKRGPLPGLGNFAERLYG